MTKEARMAYDEDIGSFLFVIQVSSSVIRASSFPVFARLQSV